MFTAVPAVITTRSPLSTMPGLAAASIDGLPELLDVRALADQQRRHAPLERQLAHRPVVVRQRRRSGAAGAAARRGRRAAGEGRHEDRRRRATPRRGRRRRSTSRRRSSGSRAPRASRAGSPCSARPRARSGPCRDRLDRILADRRLAGEHHRGGAVEDRVRDVARLGARRLGGVDHRLEHLRRGDHRLPALERLEDDPLLQQRHERRRRSRRRGRRARP